MRLAVISDIHGNWQALTAVLDDISNQQVKDIVCLGDNIGYGPEPEKIIIELAEHDIISVMGNHELALLNKEYYEKLNFITRDSLDITKTLISTASLNWIESLSPSLVTYDARFVHGCPPESITTYLFSPQSKELRNIFISFGEQICFAGHTHSLDAFTLHNSGQVEKVKLSTGIFDLDMGSRHIIVPGSVGQPRDSISDGAKYAIWDKTDHTIEIRDISYDVDTTIKLLKRHNFPLSNIKRLKWQKRI